MPGAQAPTAKQKPQPKTVELRKFKGLNVTDARVAIDDDEFSQLENAMTIGNGAIQIVPYFGDAIASFSQGVQSIWGFVLNGTPVIIVVGRDGSLTQVSGLPGGGLTILNNANAVLQLLNDLGDPLTIEAGEITTIAPAGTVTTPHLTIWRADTILILDPVTGYMKWTGSTFSVIDPNKRGVAIAVFEARAWGAANRTILISAPNTFDDFDPAHGATSFIITDEAFVGDIVALVSAVEQLWVLSHASVNAIANVQTVASPIVLTTFSNTNIVTELGTVAALSARGYFRALTFLSAFGAYALSGVTPQKLSDKLDGIFPSLVLGPDITAAVAVVNSLPVLCYLVTLNDTDGPRPILGCFTQGKWFSASQGPLTWITSVIVNGASECWGTDGTRLYQVFGAPLATPTPYRVSSRLFPLGQSVYSKASLKVGFEFQAPLPISPDVAIDSESGSVPVTLDTANAITILNNLGAPLQLQNDLGDDLNLIAGGMILAKSDVAQFGHYLGFTISGNDPPYRIQAFQLEYEQQQDQDWDYA